MKQSRTRTLVARKFSRQMFIARMFNGLVCAGSANKNANNTNQHQHQHHQQQQQQQAKSPKPNKKADKCKRSLSKTDSKKSISELFKHQNTKDAPAKDAPSTSKAAVATLKPPTKVKSGSWKRSEKQISSYNIISGKKSKSLRKRSPTWLKFPNSPVKIAEKVTYVSPADSTSVCRPGTLYSEVLFGAGSSCLVKIKTLTPRRNANTAQKKLTKALLKCSGNEDTVSDSEVETDTELFPSLNEFNKSPSPTESVKPSSSNDGPSGQATALKSDDEADVVILSETNGMSNAENGFSDISYGNYLDQHFKQMNGAAGTDNDSGGVSSSATPEAATPEKEEEPTMPKPFTIDIPQWNFIDADVSTNAYPKFLCQFEDEHYLKAEKMALLGLKLALGNNSQQGKFKF